MYSFLSSLPSFRGGRIGTSTERQIAISDAYSLLIFLFRGFGQDNRIIILSNPTKTKPRPHRRRHRQRDGRRGMFCDLHESSGHCTGLNSFGPCNTDGARCSKFRLPTAETKQVAQPRSCEAGAVELACRSRHSSVHPSSAHPLQHLLIRLLNLPQVLSESVLVHRLACSHIPEAAGIG